MSPVTIYQHPLDSYSHLLPDMQEDTIRALEETL